MTDINTTPYQSGLPRDAKNFLDKLYEGMDEDLFINIAAIGDDAFHGEFLTLAELRTTDKVQRFIDKHQAEGRNIYFGINPLATIPQHGKANKENVDEDISFVYADIDPPKHVTDINAWRKQKLAAIEKYPSTALIDSGGGFWVIYYLTEPVTHKRAEEINRIFVDDPLFQSDPAATSVANLIRMPYTVNYPNESKRKQGRQPAKATVLKFENQPFRPERFVPRSDFDDLPKEIAHIIKYATRPDGDDGPPFDGPSEARMSVMMRMFAAGFNEDRVRDIISNPDYAIAPTNKKKMKSRWCDQEVRRGKALYNSSIPEFIRELNSTYFVTKREGKTVIGEEAYDDEWQRHYYRFTKAADMNLYYANDTVLVNNKLKPKSEVWLKHPLRRTYNEMVMRPDLKPGDLGDGRLNMWRGWPINPIQGDCSYFEELVNEIICDSDKELADYWWGWMARGVQMPHLQAEVALVMRGGRGTGKGTFASYYGSLFGDHFVHISNQSHLTGNFNGHLLNCLMLFADEAIWAGSKQGESVLKALITEDRIAIEDKFMPVVNVRNRLKVLIASNERWVVPAGADERRYCVVEMNNKRQKNLDWFGKFRAQMDGSGKSALVWKLLNYDLSSFEVRRAPTTEALNEQKDQGLDAFQAFWRDELAEGDHGILNSPIPTMTWGLVPKKYLFERYLEARRQRPSKEGPTDLVNFGKRLSEVLPNGWPKRGPRMGWVIGVEQKDEGNTHRLPDLEECRRSFEEVLGRKFNWEEDEHEYEEEEEIPF